MGGGNKQQTQQATNQKSDPWAAQQPYLLDAFNQAQGVYNTQKANQTPGYQGDFVAQPTSDQVGAFQNILGGSQAALNFGSQSAGIGGASAGQGLGATSGAMGGLFGIANSDPTQANIASAGQYASNPYMDGMVDASMRDANRQFGEQVMPGINRNAAGTGNMNSTRTGIAQGIAERGLGEKAADIGAQLRGSAWSQGLGMAQQDASNRMGALTALGGLGSDATKTGLFGLGQYGDMLQKGGDAANIASANITGFNQAPIDNDLAKLNYQQAQPWSNLANYWNVVGDKSWGGTVTGTSTANQTSTPSTLSSIGSGVALLGSLFRSDARTKNLLTRYGKTKEGLDLYLYSYKDDPTAKLYIAPLAQDVQKLNPEAVIDVNGTLYINTNLYDWR